VTFTTVQYNTASIYIAPRNIPEQFQLHRVMMTMRLPADRRILNKIDDRTIFVPMAQYNHYPEFLNTNRALTICNRGMKYACMIL